MCFAPQPRALLRHLNFQEWSENAVLCTFWLGNVLRATAACTFATSQLPRVVRECCVLYILTWKCASRSSVHSCDISTSKSEPRMVCFVHFDMEMCFAPQGRALLRHLNFQEWSENGVFCTFWLENVLHATTVLSGYGLAVYGLACGPGNRFYTNHLRLSALVPSFFHTAWFFFFSKSKPPERRNLAGSAPSGFEGGRASPNPKKGGWKSCPPSNNAKALPARFLLPGGLEWLFQLQTLSKHFKPDFFYASNLGLSEFKRRRSTSSPISPFLGIGMACPPSNAAENFQPDFSSSRRFGMACPPSIRAEALPADFFLPGFWNGLSTFKPCRSTSSPISSSRGLGCQPSNPAEELPARLFFFLEVWNGLCTFKPRCSTSSPTFLLPGGLEWPVHLQTSLQHFQPDFFSGMACPPSNPAEALPARFLLSGFGMAYSGITD